jgi:hypothetical protein
MRQEDATIRPPSDITKQVQGRRKPWQRNTNHDANVLLAQIMRIQQAEPAVDIQFHSQ